MGRKKDTRAHGKGEEVSFGEICAGRMTDGGARNDQDAFIGGQREH